MEKHLLALVLILVCLLSVLTPAVHAEEPELTRIEWVQQLVTTFDMTVEDDNYPDNYYSDIESSASYYRNLMVAVEFGVIDIEAGGEFRPQDPATREFAAHTLNYCVGFQLEDGAAYTYADSAETSYPDDLQVAVNRGWFVLSDGKILPEQNVTPAEASAMLTDAAQLLKELELSDNYENTYTFATDIIEVPDGTEVIATDDTSISITDCPVTITQGDVFVVYLNEIPVPYIAGSVTQSGSVTVISATLADDETVFAGIDAQGTVVGDLRQAEAYDGTELAYYVEATEQEYRTYEEALAAVERLPATQAAGSISPKGISLSCKKELKLGDAVTFSVDGKIKNVTVSYKISLAEGVAYVKLAYDLDVTYKVKGDYIPASCISNINDITFVYWGVPGVGGFKITYDVELSGSFSGVQSWHKELGMSVSRSDGFRLIRDFKTKTFTMVAEATFQVGFKAKFGVTELPAFNAYAYASMGSVGKLKIQTYQDDAAPQKCMHFAAYLYAECGLQGSAKLIIKETVSLKYEIFNAKNSPIRISHHYEDGVLVAKCTRDANKDWFNVSLGGGGSISGGGSRGYYTPGSSGYMASGWSGGSSNTGWENGNPVVIYTYTTDDNGNATITGYNGKASGLVIPATIDGHTVVAIGNGAFRGNSRLRAVIFPDTVTEIGENAFAGSDLQTVSIPDSVTKIGDSAFCECKGLTEVTLPAGLKELGGMAFGKCSGLTEITIPKSLTTAHFSAGFEDGGPFGYCENLTTVIFEDGITKVPPYLFRRCTGKMQTVIPDGVTEIGRAAFMNSGLQSVVMPDTVTEIGENAFAGSNLQSVSIPDSVTKIGDSAFCECKGLTEVTLPAGLKELDGMAFGKCSGLTEITIPKSLTTAHYSSGIGGGGPFGYCENLTTVIFEDGITKIPEYLFRYCTGKIELVLPDTVTEIGRAAFTNSGIQSIVIPDNVTEIGENAFAGSNLQTVSIPDSVTKIGDSAFCECKGLTEVTLPAGLKELDGMAFGKCSGLTEITIPKSLTTAHYSSGIGGGGPFGYCENLTTVIFEDGIAKIPEYLFRYCTGKIQTVIPDGATEIGRAAFTNSGLQSIVMPDTVTRIEENAFRESMLQTVSIPDSVTKIGQYVFYNCQDLTEVKLSARLEEIGEYAFADSGLQSVSIPDTVTKTGDAIFKNCSALTDAKLSNSCTNINYSMFEGCSALRKILIPDTVTTVYNSAFQNCTSLKEVIWSESLVTLRKNAFYNCSSLTEVVLPEKVTTIGDSVFYNCDSLTAITIPDSVTSFGTSMFYDCDALVTVNLGSGLTAIPKSSFEHCDVLESVTVPRRVTSIAADAFKNSVKFTSIFIPRSVTSIDSTAFSYPAKLTIYGVPGTYAETFANENSITFVAQQTGATAVALDQTTLSLAKGSSAQLKLTVTPENFTDAVTWKSADTSVATVSDTGLVKAVNNGSTVIKVTVGSVSASCKVTVVQPVTGISLNRTSLTLEALGTFQLTVRITPANAEDPRVRWSSSAPEIAAVSDTGLVTALKKGTAVITVTSMDGSNISRTCTVTVSNTAYICKTADELESPHNYENSCTDVWSYTLPGATELNVTFDTRTCMEDGFDFLYLYDANGTEIGKYTGTELAGKTITIPGDTVRIKMASDDSGNEWGFKAQVRADAGELANGVKWSFRPSENTLSINGAILEGHKVLIACYDDNGKLTKLEVWTVSGSVKLPDSARICVFYIDEANKPLCAAATVRG